MRVVPVDAATYAEVRDLLARHPHVFDNIALAALPGAYTDDATVGGAPLAQLANGLRFGRVMFPHHTTDIADIADIAVHRVDDDDTWIPSAD